MLVLQSVYLPNVEGKKKPNVECKKKNTERVVLTGGLSTLRACENTLISISVVLYSLLKTSQCWIRTSPKATDITGVPLVLPLLFLLGEAH